LICMNIRLALNENVAQRCLARQPFLLCEFLVQAGVKVSRISADLRSGTF